MINLNLTENNEAEKRIKEYLENNVSEELANKINNGTSIIKDNKTLINKKTLSSFMNYANEEARKIAEKNARYACVEDNTVYGWAIHYFEENSIEGILYNEDGTEYKAPLKTVNKEKSKPAVKVVEKPKEENKQATLFDFFDNQEQKEIVEEPEEIVENTDEQLEENELIETIEAIQKTSTLSEEELQDLIDQQNIEPDFEEETEIDFETGEIIPKRNTPKTFDKENLEILYTLLDGKLEVK